MTEEEVPDVRRLVREGMSQEIVRREVLKEGTYQTRALPTDPPGVG
jgi:hypothetical protein